VNVPDVCREPELEEARVKGGGGGSQGQE
jgi:hypothetical protein